jgi:uncharacterized GH25 family protein
MTRPQLRLAPALASALALAFVAGFPLAAQAHKAWLLPSETVLSANGWITVDAAVSNDLFYFNHQPMRLENLEILGPDGAPVAATNQNTGRYRSTFDVNLVTSGTYKLALINHSLNATYETAQGEKKRWRGTAAALATEIPADAKNVKVSETQGRIETFVTSGKPNDTALKPTGVGLELVPVTHPNDLVAGEPIQFRFVLDGKPAANLEIEVVPGGSRYRNEQNDTKVTTDKDGLMSVTWQEPGMYWIETVVQDNKTSVKQASFRRATYVATFEVLPQ